METTRLIALHTNKGKTPAQSIPERLEYSMNPEKTNGGVLISSYGCTPQTAAMELNNGQFTHKLFKEILFYNSI